MSTTALAYHLHTCRSHRRTRSAAAAAALALLLVPIAGCSGGSDHETVSAGDWVDNNMKPLGDGLLAAAGKVDLSPDTVDTSTCQALGDWVDQANSSPFPEGKLGDGWQSVVDAGDDAYQACKGGDVNETISGMQKIQHSIGDMQDIIRSL